MNAHTTSEPRHVGWSDFVLTIAEHLFPTMGLYRVSRFLVNRHYADPGFRPGAKSLALARIAEKEGDFPTAEQHYRAAMKANAAEPDPYLYLGQFYERREKIELAIETYEQALRLARQEPELTSAIADRLRRLRSGT